MAAVNVDTAPTFGLPPMKCPLCWSYRVSARKPGNFGKHLASCHTLSKIDSSVHTNEMTQAPTLCSRCSLSKNWHRKSEFAAPKASEPDKYKHACMTEYAASNWSKDMRFSVYCALVGVRFCRLVYQEVLQNVPHAMDTIDDYLKLGGKFDNFEPVVHVFKPGRHGGKRGKLLVVSENGDILKMVLYFSRRYLLDIYKFLHPDSPIARRLLQYPTLGTEDNPGTSPVKTSSEDDQSDPPQRKSERKTTKRISNPVNDSDNGSDSKSSSDSDSDNDQSATRGKSPKLTSPLPPLSQHEIETLRRQIQDLSSRLPEHAKYAEIARQHRLATKNIIRQKQVSFRRRPSHQASFTYRLPSSYTSGDIGKGKVGGKGKGKGKSSKRKGSKSGLKRHYDDDAEKVVKRRKVSESPKSPKSKSVSPKSELPVVRGCSVRLSDVTLSTSGQGTEIVEAAADTSVVMPDVSEDVTPVPHVPQTRPSPGIHHVPEGSCAAEKSGKLQTFIRRISTDVPDAQIEETKPGEYLTLEISREGDETPSPSPKYSDISGEEDTELYDTAVIKEKPSGDDGTLFVCSPVKIERRRDSYETPQQSESQMASQHGSSRHPSPKEVESTMVYGPVSSQGVIVSPSRVRSKESSKHSSKQSTPGSSGRTTIMKEEATPAQSVSPNQDPDQSFEILSDSKNVSINADLDTPATRETSAQCERIRGIRPIPLMCDQWTEFEPELCDPETPKILATEKSRQDNDNGVSNTPMPGEDKRKTVSDVPVRPNEPVASTSSDVHSNLRVVDTDFSINVPNPQHLVQGVPSAETLGCTEFQRQYLLALFGTKPVSAIPDVSHLVCLHKLPDTTTQHPVVFQDNHYIRFTARVRDTNCLLFVDVPDHVTNPMAVFRDLPFLQPYFGNTTFVNFNEQRGARFVTTPVLSMALSTLTPGASETQHEPQPENPESPNKSPDHESK